MLQRVGLELRVYAPQRQKAEASYLQSGQMCQGKRWLHNTDAWFAESAFVYFPSFAEQLLPAVLPCPSRVPCALEGDDEGSNQAGRTENFSQEDFHVTRVA